MIKFIGILLAVSGAYALSSNTKYSRYGFPLLALASVYFIYMSYTVSDILFLLASIGMFCAFTLGTLRHFILPVEISFPATQTEIEIRVTTLASGDVDSRAYVNNKPLIVKDALGKDYHLGQVSSNLTWALRDIPEHFSDDFDMIFPKGWVIHFKY